MVSSLLLIALPSILSCLRQPILWLSQRRLLLRQSFQWWLAAWSPTHTPVSESQPLLLSFQQPVFRYLRLALSAGFPGGDYWSHLDKPAPILALLGQASL